MAPRVLSPQLFYELDSPSDKLKRVSSSSSISSMGGMVIVHHPGTLASGSSLGTLPTLAYGSVYMKLWNGLGNLDSDPHPQVAQMSSVVTGHIRNQVLFFTISIYISPDFFIIGFKGERNKCAERKRH